MAQNGELSGGEGERRECYSFALSSYSSSSLVFYCLLLLAPSPLNLNTRNMLKLAQGYDQIKTVESQSSLCIPLIDWIFLPQCLVPVQIGSNIVRVCSKVSTHGGFGTCNGYVFTLLQCVFRNLDLKGILFRFSPLLWVYRTLLDLFLWVFDVSRKLLQGEPKLIYRLTFRCLKFKKNSSSNHNCLRQYEREFWAAIVNRRIARDAAANVFRNLRGSY